MSLLDLPQPETDAAYLKQRVGMLIVSDLFDLFKAMQRDIEMIRAAWVRT